MKFNIRSLKVLGVVAMILAVLASGTSVALAQPTPDKDWKTNNTVQTVGDCTGVSNQTNSATHSDAGQLCQNYDTPSEGQTDVYESLDSTVADLSGVDIENLNLACNGDFLYLEWETVTPPDMDTSHDFLATIDIDPGTETELREDYYFQFAAAKGWLAGPNADPDWVDTNSSGAPSSNGHCDAETGGSGNDVGGDQPLRSDEGTSGASSNFNDCTIEDADNKVFIRSTSYTGTSGVNEVNTGFMQMAINLDVGQSTDGVNLDDISCSSLRVRIWSSQTSTFAPDGIPWHDGQTVSDLSSWDHDNTLWFSGTVVTAVRLASFTASSVLGHSVSFAALAVGLMSAGLVVGVVAARRRRHGA